MCGVPMAAVQESVTELLELLRNASAVIGDGPDAAAFRKRCVQLAYHRACTLVVPALVEAGLLKETSSLSNLVDISILFQNQCIESGTAANQ